MSSLRFNTSVFALPLAIVVVVGCGNDTGEVSVTGSVTFKGRPLPSASLAFYPSDGSVAMANIVDGEYEAKLAPGAYRVTVTLGAPVLPPGWKDGDPVPQQGIELPPAYGSRVNTPLTATVTADGRAQTIDFEMK